VPLAIIQDEVILADVRDGNEKIDSFVKEKITPRRLG